MEKKEIRFINKSGNARREVKGELSLLVEEKKFEIDYELVREEKATDDNGNAILKKVRTARKEVGMFNDVDSITKPIPISSLVFNGVLLVAFIIILLLQNTFEWYVWVLAALVFVLLVWDTFKELWNMLRTYSVRFNSQVVYVIRFIKKGDGQDFFTTVSQGRIDHNESTSDHQ